MVVATFVNTVDCSGCCYFREYQHCLLLLFAAFVNLNCIVQMAAIKGVELRIPPLELKENSELECWRDFIQRFEIALINTNLATIRTPSSGESSSKKADANEEIDFEFKRGGLLLNSIGAEGYRVFTKWKIAAADIRYTDLVARFEEKFMGRQNLFITRHRFLSMEQMAGEKVEIYIDRVAKAAMYCDLRDLEEALVLQIVTKGLRSDKLRKDLLATDALDLRKARNLCHLFTSAEESNDLLTDKPSAEVAKVSRKPMPKNKGQKGNSGCFICKAQDHWAKDCPKKREIVCFKCNKKGHYAKQCRSGKIQEVTAKETDSESDESL